MTITAMKVTNRQAANIFTRTSGTGRFFPPSAGSNKRSSPLKFRPLPSDNR